MISWAMTNEIDLDLVQPVLESIVHSITQILYQQELSYWTCLHKKIKMIVYIQSLLLQFNNLYMVHQRVK